MSYIWAPDDPQPERPTMTYIEWRDMHCPSDLPPLYLAMVTEGLSSAKHHPLAVVLGQLDASGGLAIETLGLPDGDASLSEQFTGFTRDMHDACRMQVGELPQIAARLSGRVVVTYTARRFTLPFLDRIAEYTVVRPSVAPLAVLDVQSLWACSLDPDGFRAEDTPASLLDRKGGGSVDSIFEATGMAEAWAPALAALPVYQRRIMQMHAIVGALEARL
jgi:hypothetical protein